MMHSKRRWSVADAESADWLQDNITERTWVLCSGFRFEGLLYLNDSTSEDALQEYGVVRESDGKQMETLTVSWMGDGKLLAWLREEAPGLLNGKPIWPFGQVDLATQVGTHGYATGDPCHLCR